MMIPFYGKNYVAIIDYDNNNGVGIDPLPDDGNISPDGDMRAA